jgi:hypothetical protein
MKFFKFNQIIPLFAICLMTINEITAQNNLHFSMKGGPLVATMKFAVGQKEIGGDEPTFKPGATTMAMAFNLPLYKRFRIGSEIGFNSLENSFSKEIYGSNYIGRYKINQVYFAIVPELTIYKWIYANAGIGFYADFDSEVKNGLAFNTSQSPSTRDITGESFKRNKLFGYFFGVGICPNITKDLAVLAEIRFVGNPNGATSSDWVNVGYSGGNFNIGLMYKPR